ncbi:MAG: sialidase family protein, partial [Spirochaetaceae bacterium]|nr:sialidase family protein [Spirochaetaceae bacterium]
MVGFDQPGHLIRLADGRLLCTYGRRSTPFGQRACLSEDEGRTWRMDTEVVLRDDGAGTDLGYPASAEVSPGEVLTVYYQVDRPGEKVCINATRWSLGGG